MQSMILDSQIHFHLTMHLSAEEAVEVPLAPAELAGGHAALQVGDVPLEVAEGGAVLPLPLQAVAVVVVLAGAAVPHHHVQQRLP